MLSKLLRYTLLMSLFVMLATACAPANSQVQSTLKDALTFYASFDEGFKADYATGDAEMYIVPAWDMDSTLTIVQGTEDLVTRLEAGGKSGGALRFSTDWNPVVFYKAEDNVAYEEQAWTGSFSFWLRIDPETGLEQGYSDPFIITDKNWDNASFYVDFTQDEPRHFRFAAFSDYSLWNPDGLAWDDVPVAQRPMIDVTDLPFSADAWTHVVLTFDAVNEAGTESEMKGYLNGELIGTFNKEISISWDRERVLMAIGRHYAGDFDDLSVFNRALTEEEVKQVYSTPIIDLL